VKTYISIFLTLFFLSQSAESKEAAYVTVADESGYTQIAVIDLENPQIVKYIPIGPNALFGNLVLTPDGRSLLLAGRFANKIYQIDIETNTVVDSMEFFQPYRIAMTPDAKHVLIANWQGTKVSYLDWPQKLIVYEIEGERGFVSDEVLFTPDGRLAYLQGVDHFTVVDVGKGEIIESVPLAGIRSMAWNGHKKLLYAIDNTSRRISKIDSSSHQIIGHIELNLDGNLSQICFDFCEEHLYVSTDVTHQILDIETENTIRQLPTPSTQNLYIGDVQFTPNGKNIYLTTSISQAIDSGSSKPGQVWVLSTTQNVILYKLDIGFQPISISMVVYPPPMQGDFNSDQHIEFADFILFAAAFGTTIQDKNWDCDYDLVRDNKIDFSDFIMFVQFFNEGG
jgi:DNA-binding beta-propeller fold protein YncE